MVSYNIAFNTVLVLAGVLLVIFLFLLGYTLWTRIKKQYWQQYRQKFRDHYSPLIFDFIEGNGGHAEADTLIKKLSKFGRDISFFLELLEEMRDLLKGDERKKLDVLIEHEIFYDYYRAGLFSFSAQKQLMACLYFEKISTIGSRVAARLMSISKSRRLQLAYAAAKGLQSSKESVVRRNALIRFLKRPDISDLMVGELLNSFYGDGERSQETIAKGLKNILVKSDIDASKKKIVVLFLAGKNFYEQGEFLLDYLNRLQYSQAKAPLIIGLIKALGHLQVEEAGAIIRDYFELDNEELQLACVWSLGKLGGKENLVYLTQQLLTVDFSVRKSILEMVASNSKWGLRLLTNFMTANLQMIERYEDQQEYPDDLSPLIHRIYDTVLGIRIMLSQKKVAAGNA